MGNARRKPIEVGELLLEDVDPQSIEHLILEGAVEPAGMDLETGEMLYSFTPKLEEVNPEVYRGVYDYMHSIVLSLWEKGFLDIDMEEADPIISATSKSSDLQAIEAELINMEQQVLEQTLKALDQNSEV